MLYVTILSVIFNGSYRPERLILSDVLSRVTLKFDGWLWKQWGTFSVLLQALHIISWPLVNSDKSCTPETLNSDENRPFFVPCDLEIWRMTLKNIRARLPCNFKPCAPCRNHQSIQTGVTVWKRPIWVKISKFFITCVLKIWWMTLTNNRAPLLCYFKLCAFFHNHRLIQTWVRAQKCPIWVKICYFVSRVTLKFDRWPWKTIGHLFYATSSFVHQFIAIWEFSYSYFSPLWPWHVTSEFWVNICSGNGLLSYDSKPLSGTVVTYHQWFRMTIIWGSFKWNS